MRPKSIALLLLALGCGLVAAIGVTQVMSNQDDAPEAVAQGELTVFVVKDDIKSGTFLTPDLLRLEEWPKDAIPEGSLSKIEDIEGRRTNTKMYAGESILDAKLYAVGEAAGGVDTEIPKGYRVVTVKVDKVTGLNDMLLPGNRVDLSLFVTRCEAKGIRNTGMFTFLQDVRIFAVNDIVNANAADPNDPTSIRAMTVSLVVTPQQAEKIALATELGKLRLLLRRPDDNEVGEYKNITARQLMGEGTDIADRQKELPQEPGDQGLLSRIAELALREQNTAPPAAVVIARPRGEIWRMRLVKGPEIQETILELQGGEEADPKTGRWSISDAGLEPGFSMATDQPDVETPDARGYQPSAETHDAPAEESQEEAEVEADS